MAKIRYRGNDVFLTESAQSGKNLRLMESCLADDQLLFSCVELIPERESDPGFHLCSIDLEC